MANAIKISSLGKEIQNTFVKENINDINSVGFPVWYEKKNGNFENVYFENVNEESLETFIDEFDIENMTNRTWKSISYRLIKSRTSEEKAKIRELRKGKGETELRVKLDDFNKFSVYWQNDNIKKVVEKMPKILDYSEDTILSHRLQLAFIDLDKSDYQQLNDKIKIMNI